MVLAAASVAAVVMWPKRYTVGQHMGQTVVFWNNQAAFIFLTLNSTGRSPNIFQDKLATTRYGYPALLAGGFGSFSRQEVVAYHLAASGKLDRFPLPEKTTTYGSWTLVDGHLQLTPPPSTSRDWTGIRWDGQAFVPVPASTQP